MKSKTHFFKDLNLSTILEPADPSDKNYCATKVVGTIGPACQAVDKQVAMLEAGMSAARYGPCSTQPLYTQPLAICAWSCYGQ
jgi:hypothetical protein